MTSYTFLAEVEPIMLAARKSAIELGQDTVSSEILLNAIVSDNANSGVQTITANGGNLVKIKSELRNRLEVIARAPSGTALPNVSAALHHIINFAGVISPSGITAASLVQSMYRTGESVGSQILSACGYSEPGDTRRPSSEGSFRKSNTPTINKFCVDVTRQAVRGELDPVIGRDKEIQQMVEILSRRKKNNPVLIGEPGVGKTSIVEGLALRIAAGTVPESLQSKRIMSLNLNAVVSGTQYRGQFEERMQNLISEISGDTETIIFIDELHSLMGTGGVEGTGDSASIVKPALSSGKMRCIGTTTLDDYRKHIEKDGALERRFQRVMVEPPSMQDTMQVISQIAPLYEKFHNVTFDAGVPDTVVKLAEKYISDRQFPDKAIDILDQAASTAKLGKRNVVTDLDVQEVISKRTGIPTVSLGKSERERLKTIETDLSKVVIGQDPALAELAKAIKAVRTGVRSGARPSSFLMLGPTGVGKTETAKQLAKYLFDREDAMIRIDMSEFSEKFSTSTLVGAPPGYVGYEEGGKLTEKVRRHPYSVILLDEIEKAHPDVFNILLQVLDDGILTDAAGRVINFKNCIIIITSNVGAKLANKKSLGFSASVNDVVQQHFEKALKDTFKPEFLNRLDAIVVYKPLDKQSIAKILDIYLSTMPGQFKISVTDAAKEYFVTEGYSEEYGARPLRRLVANTIEAQMSNILLDTPDATEFAVDLVSNKIEVSIPQKA